MQEKQNEIILYQPDNAVEVEVRLENETVRLTQNQIALLFGVKQPAISKHLKNIFSSGELDEFSVYSILEYTAADGKIYKTDSYHDRFLFIDNTVYHIGASLKDLGKKLFAFSKMGIKHTDILKNN